MPRITLVALSTLATLLIACAPDRPQAAVAASSSLAPASSPSAPSSADTPSSGGAPASSPASLYSSSPASPASETAPERTAREPLLLLDPAQPLPSGWRNQGLTLQPLAAGDGRPARLRLTSGNAGGVLRIPLREVLDHDRGLTLWLACDQPTTVRWWLLDAQGRGIWQKRADLPAGASTVRWPLSTVWRWGQRVAAPDEGRTLAIAVARGSARTLELGRIEAVDAPVDEAALHRQLLGEGAVSWRTGRWLVVSEGQLSPEARLQLDRVLEPIEPWLRRLFGEAVRPIAPRRPLALVIPREREGTLRYLAALGRLWNVTIGRPKATGLTVGDVAVAHWDGLGSPRPVLLHEAVHGAVARTLRLQPGKASDSWLQEATANYLQLALYPDSLPHTTLARHFGLPIDPQGRSFFKPLSGLLGRPIDTRHYAQLASLFGYLHETQPGWLAALARGTADGAKPADILRRLGTDADKLQAAWVRWGQSRFRERGFARPEEWKQP